MGPHVGFVIWNLFVIILAAKICGELAERLGQPAVLGELVAGVMIGGSVLGLAQNDIVINSFAAIGIILLLFEIGITTEVSSFLRVGLRAIIVASIGVFFPFLGGFIVTRLMGFDTIHAIFIGATLTATSVGITARVLSDLKSIHLDESRIIIGAAVADDVIGLVILGVMVGLINSGTISFGNIMYISSLAVLFLVLSFIIGVKMAPFLLKVIQQMKVRGILIAMAFAFCLLLSFFAEKIGLATIVGAFAAGLVLAKTESKTHIEERVKPLTDIFAPVFFVTMGMAVDVKIFNIFEVANQQIMFFAVILIIVAIIGKLLAGLGEIKRKTSKLLVGIGMIPRGEVGLIFVAFGLTHKVITQDIYSAVLIVIIVTTFITPPALKWALHRRDKKLRNAPIVV